MQAVHTVGKVLKNLETTAAKPKSPSKYLANLCSRSLFVIISDYVIKRFLFSCSQSGPIAKTAQNTQIN